MSSKNEFISLEKASKTLKQIEEYYPIFYQNSIEDLKIFKRKAYNSKNDFWEKLRIDTVHFVSEDFKYSADRVYQFFKASDDTPSNPYVRNFDIEEIECLKELALTYQTHIYNTETKQAVLKEKTPQDKNPKKRLSNKQIIYGLACIVLIAPILILIKTCSFTKEEKENPLLNKKILDEKVMDTIKTQKDSLQKEKNNMIINIQVKDSGKINQINNFNNVKEVNL